MTEKKTFAPDWGLFIVILMLVSLGLVAVYDSSYAFAMESKIGNGFHFVRKQAIAAVLGLCVMFGLMKIPYWKLTKLSVWAFLVTLILLALTLKFAPERLGAKRWLVFGPLQIQPSELVKLALILFVAHLLSTRTWIVKNLWGGVAILFGLCAVPIVIVERQPDLGTAVTILLIVLGMLFAAGVRGRWLAGIIALCGILGFAAAAGKGFDNYRWKRVITFVNPDADKLNTGFQIRHSTIALGTGGLTGVGLGQSREKRTGGLPERHTDFIFSVLGEETGWLGACGILLLYALLGVRGFTIACESRDPLGQLLAIGITVMVLGQALVNVAVVSASMPATGVPLPLISYGGSALVTNLAAMGVLLNISMHPLRGGKKRPENKRRPSDALLKRMGLE
jgi:cell division protein FtsW